MFKKIFANRTSKTTHYSSKHHCLWCGKDLNKQEDILSYFIYDDCLCYQCRNQLSVHNCFFSIDNIHIHSIYPYTGFGRELLIQYKELNDEALYSAFLYPIRKKLAHKYAGYTLVQIPSNSRSIKARGFNHVEKMFSLLNLQTLDLFEKNSLTEQKHLSRQERFIASNSIKLRQGMVLPSSRLLIVDDLITTGASIKSAYSLLLNHPYKVSCLTCFAHEMFYRKYK